jgi:HSP20 family protein
MPGRKDGWSGSEPDPLADILRLQERMNRLFSESLARNVGQARRLESRAWAPAADVVETPDAYLLAVELAGIEEEHVELVAESDGLLLRGERPIDAVRPHAFYRMERAYGRLERHFRFSEPVDPERVRGEFQDGLLRLTVPKLRRRIGPARSGPL